MTRLNERLEREKVNQRKKIPPGQQKKEDDGDRPGKGNEKKKSKKD
jgi:hypothetical protein